MNPDGTNIDQLTNNSAQDASPTWSPDGSKIAFVSNRDGNWEIYTMDHPHGTGVTRLTNDPAADAHPDWSKPTIQALTPTIAFQSNRDGTNDEIYTMKPDGTNLMQITHNKAAFDGVPSWSPDGRWIAFSSDRSNIQKNRFEIYTMDYAGDALNQLTSNDKLDTEPVWSPNGKSIAFARLIPNSAGQYGKWQIYTIRAEGLYETAVQTDTAGHSTFSARDPDWQALPCMDPPFCSR
jgi:Tol biopolymer transport system component